MSLPSIQDYLPEASAAIAKLAFVKIALPEPPPDSGEPPQKQEPGSNELPKSPLLHGAKAVGAGLLGFGVGTAAGYGAGRGIEALTGKVPTGPLRKAAPVVGGLMGLSYNLYKQKELEELRRALESHQSRPQSGSP